MEAWSVELATVPARSTLNAVACEALKPICEARRPEFRGSGARHHIGNEVGSDPAPSQARVPTRRSRRHALQSRAASAIAIGTAGVSRRMPEGSPRARRLVVCGARNLSDGLPSITRANYEREILGGTTALAIPSVVPAVAGPASAQSWQYFGNTTAAAPDFGPACTANPTTATSRGNPGCAYAPGYAFVPRYNYAPRR